jgi:hypothetical protein
MRQITLNVALVLFTAIAAQAQQPGAIQQPPQAAQQSTPATSDAKILELQKQIDALKLQKEIDDLEAKKRALTQQGQPQRPGQPQPQPAPPKSDCMPAKQAPKPHVGFHVPKGIQNALNKEAQKIGNKTGIDLDPNTPGEVVRDAQKPHPCPAPAQTPAGGAPKQ